MNVKFSAFVAVALGLALFAPEPVPATTKVVGSTHVTTASRELRTEVHNAVGCNADSKLLTALAEEDDTVEVETDTGGAGRRCRSMCADLYLLCRSHCPKPCKICMDEYIRCLKIC
jgi:hypothetical protein